MKSLTLLRTIVLALQIALLSCAASLAADPFPKFGLLPKKETGALRFLAEHAEYDGRGVVVAIFDTGVDPGAPGLQTTSDGRPKIVDMVDGSGSGDVDTSTIRKVKDGTIIGLSGRQLAIPSKWNCPTGEFRIGIKRGYELFPTRLLPRLKEKRRKTWDAAQRDAVTQLRKQIADWNAEHKNPSKRQRRDCEDLQTRLEILNELQENHDDPGPIFDCVVFHDGEFWRAAIDTDEDGDLADENVLTNFRAERQFATFGIADLLNFSVNIYDDGNVLSIVCDCGAHGTHVAGIVAGHFSDRPELNGLAPGAQIVSVKIGDRRLGSSSVRTGGVRGAIAVLENKCDLINMSYGGPTSNPNQGRVIDLYKELVNKHGVIFVASAGNSGPALSTVTSPGGTTSAILGVGAYVSPAMMKASYSMRKELPDMPYTWSSRGPTLDGDLGVDICAPGGAIAPVPNWVLQQNKMMNGTSMSSPNACGGIALLLSGLKARRTKYSPYSVRRALQNTARPIKGGDVFAHGQGVIQIDAAFEYLQAHADATGEQLRFEVSLPGRRGARGIYLRDPHEANRVLETEVQIRPVFHEDADNRGRVDFQMRVAIECTASWVSAGKHLLLVHGGDDFKVRVDPKLAGRGLSFAEVIGFDADDRERGPIFRLPVTIVRPDVEPDDEGLVWSLKKKFKPGEIVRRFVAVPRGATWADLTVRANHTDAQRLVVAHAMQTLPRRGYGRGHQRHYLWLSPEAEAVRSFPVVGGHTLELCVAQFWSSLGAGDFEYKLTFHGLAPDDSVLQLDGSRLTHRVELSAPLRDERLEPAAKLDILRTAIHPNKSESRPLVDMRDALPDRRQIHQVVLQYDFELDEEAEVIPRLALNLHNEARLTFQSQIWMIFDKGRRLAAVGTGEKWAKLDKGKYVLRFHVRCDDPSLLDRVDDQVLLLDRKLKKPVKLAVYDDPNQALADGKQASPQTIERGGRKVIYLAVNGGIPDAAAPGDQLLGTLTFGKAADKAAGSGQRPDGFEVSLIVPPKPISNKTDVESSDKSKQNSLEDAVLKAKLGHLKSLSKADDWEESMQFATALAKEYPNDLTVLSAHLRTLDDDGRLERLPEIIKAADRLVAKINAGQLAVYFAKSRDPDRDDDEVHAEREEQKAALVDALLRKCLALADALESDDAKTNRIASAKKFERTFARLRDWVDEDGDKFTALNIRRDRRNGRLGFALKRLNERIADSAPDRKLHETRAAVFDELNWNHWRDYERRWLLIRFPDTYPIF